jgi:5,10-methylenetetrahydrofolate reductase
MRLRDKITKGKRPVVVYEILPPRIIDGTIESYAERISTLLSKTHIDAINIPEVHAEESRGERPVEDRKRAFPRDFGRIIQDSVGVEVIVNRVTVLENHKDQREWFRETSEDFGIDNIVLVGGESGEIDYPGPGVSEAATMIEEINSETEGDIFSGGIVLPSRKVESERMERKSRSGVKFFTTQVLYDSHDICRLLWYYNNAVQESGSIPRRVLLSFAPISTKKNLEFLKWLGVEIPEETEEELVNSEEGIKERSLEICMRLLEEILSFVTENEIRVPIGLNVEHIMTYNFDHSVELLQKMSKRYRSFCMSSDLYESQPDS